LFDTDMMSIGWKQFRKRSLARDRKKHPTLYNRKTNHSSTELLPKSPASFIHLA